MLYYTYYNHLFDYLLLKGENTLNRPQNNNVPRPTIQPKIIKRATPLSTPPSQNSTPNNKARKPIRKPVQKKIKRKVSTARKQRIVAVLILLLTLYLLISLSIGGLIYFSFDKEAKSDDIYALKLYQAETRKYSFESTIVNNAYGLYVPYKALSELCNLGIAGDDGTVIILLSPDGGTIECKNNSSLVYINDNAVRISAPVLFESDDYKIPIELIESYLIGVEVVYNEETMLCTVTAPEDSADITLKVQFPIEISTTYFPEDYKTFPEISDVSNISDVSK